MKIKSIHLRRFRGLACASLVDCAALNVLIGRNNAGKSSVIAALEIALPHLAAGKVAAIWNTRNRPVDEFTNRESGSPLQIGLSFNLTPDINENIRKQIVASGSGLELSANQLKSADLVSVICSGMLDGDEAVLFVQELGLGPIDASGNDLRINEGRLLSIPKNVVEEFSARERTIARIRNDIKSIDQIDGAFLDYTYREPSANRARRFREVRSSIGTSIELQAKIDDLLTNKDSKDNFASAVAQLKASYELDIAELDNAPTHESFSIFSGNVNVVPEYILSLLQTIGNTQIVSFKETRNAVGREEAAQILRLKTKRGGAEALARVQGTVKALLGVQVDAFEPEQPTRRRTTTRLTEAEMDVDDFLVEANGAGIREALRIILDLELKSPSIAFVEEPEVHLHPGLEKVLHNYLVRKSATVQLVLATHSANFLDASARQNVYLVSKENATTSTITKVASEGDLLKVSEEVGLRPSTVLMFDRLVFVEGPSDEEIMSELAVKLNLDLAASSTAFVQMGGATRFAHYAAEATLKLLSRRQIKMWFVIDKDERDDTDVARLLESLGDRAELTFLGRREIENYLLFPDAIAALLREKLQSAASTKMPSVEEVEALIQSSAKDLFERAVYLRLAKAVLKPVYPNHGGNNAQERLEAMHGAIAQRLTTLEAAEAKIRADLTGPWEKGAEKLAPGSEILDRVFTHYGARYKKEVDGRRLAAHIDPSKLDPEITRFLRKVAAVN